MRRTSAVRPPLAGHRHLSSCRRSCTLERQSSPVTARSRQVDGHDLFKLDRLFELADRVVELAKANHPKLVGGKWRTCSRSCDRESLSPDSTSTFSSPVHAARSAFTISSRHQRQLSDESSSSSACRSQSPVGRLRLLPCRHARTNASTGSSSELVRYSSMASGWPRR